MIIDPNKNMTTELNTALENRGGWVAQKHAYSFKDTAEHAEKAINTSVEQNNQLLFFLRTVG